VGRGRAHHEKHISVPEEPQQMRSDSHIPLLGLLILRRAAGSVCGRAAALSLSRGMNSSRRGVSASSRGPTRAMRVRRPRSNAQPPYALLHPSQQCEFQPPATDLDMKDIIVDPLHDLMLNVPKVIWKYCFGDRMTNAQRELVAEYLLWCCVARAAGAAPLPCCVLEATVRCSVDGS
jgi:hypothetical protein